MKFYVETYSEFTNEKLVIDTLNYDVYRNPKSIKRMSPWKRAISDDNGDLYVLDDTDFSMVHGDLVWELNSRKIVTSGSTYENLLHNFVAWTQVGNQNVFYLSESYSTTNRGYWNSLKNFSKHIKNLTKLVERKNPQFKYVQKRIWDNFKQPESVSIEKTGTVVRK